MATAWRQTEASDSEDDVIFMGPVTEREIEISRLLNETICLADADASDDANTTLAGLEGNLRACTLEGARESCTMNELELPTTGAGGDSRRFPMTSSRLDMSAAPLASGESAGSHQWEQELLLSSTRLTEQPEQEQSGRRRSQRRSSGRRESGKRDSERQEESRVWQEMPSENPLPAPPVDGEESQQWEEMPSELQPPPDNGEESQRWEEMPSECHAPAALNESMCEDSSSESLPTPSAAGEESQRWEEMPSECQPPPSAVAEESQRWEELPSECQPPPSVLNESMREDSSEELPSQGELATAAAAVAEESQKWEEMPSECQPPPSEQSQRWEELPSECQPPPDDGEDSQRWDDMPSKSHYPPSVLEESICEDLSDEPLPAVDGSRWLTLGADDRERPSPGALRGKPRRSATQTGALLDALCEELDASRRCSSGTAARSPPMRSASAGGSGLLQAMHRQMTSPSAVSVAASVESYHTCVGGASADDSRRLTAASALSDISMNPAAPPNTTLGTEAVETDSEDDSRLYESSVEEQPDQQQQQQKRQRLSSSAAAATAERSVSRVSRVSEVSDGSRLDDSCADDADDSARDADDSAGDYSDSRPASARDRIASLASESSLGGSRMSGTSTGGSELNDTLEMMEKLLAMEAEERRLESILQSRTAAGATALGEDSELGVGDGVEVVVPKTKTTPAVAVSSATPLRQGASAVQRTTPAAPTPRGRGRPAVPTPRQRAAGRSPARMATPRARTGRSPARSPARSATATPARSTTATPARSATATPARSAAATATPARSATTAGATPARSTTFTATPARSTTAAAAPASRLKTPTPVTRPTAAMVAAAMLTPRSKPNLKDIVSPVARYIHDGPEPSLVQNVRPKTRMINSVVPQARPPLAPLAEVSPPVPLSKTENSQEAENEVATKTSQETAQEATHVLRDLNASNVSNASTASAGSSASAGSRIPVKVSRSAVGRENQPPPSSLPTVSYKTSGNMVMDKSEWTKLVRKNTAENRKIGRFLASPAPVLTVKHTGHKSVASRRVRWNDEFSVPDMAVRVRPMRRSVSDCDMSRSTEASLMEVSVCEVRTARPTGAVRH